MTIVPSYRAIDLPIYRVSLGIRLAKVLVKENDCNAPLTKHVVILLHE